MKDRPKFVSARQAAEKQDTGGNRPYVSLPNKVGLLKLKEGVMLVDILPYIVGKGNPMADKGMMYYERSFFVHRGIGPNEETHLCLRKTFGEACPVCEYRAKLQRQADDENEDEIKSLAPKHRQLMNVIDRKNPEKGIQILEMSFHLFGRRLNKEILAGDEDEGLDKFYLPDEGLTLKLGIGEESMGGRSFNAVETISFKPRKEQYDDGILDETHCLDELLVATPYEELKKLLLQTDEGEDDEKPKGKRRDEPEEDEDEKPKRRRDDDEDEEKPKSKRRDEPEEDEDKPKRRRDEPEEDDDEKPKRRRDEPEEDEDEKPKGKRRDEPEEDEDKPKSKRRGESEDDEWNERPRVHAGYPKDEPEDDEKPKSKRRDEPEEDEDEKPKGKRPKDTDDDWEDFEKRKKAKDEPEDDEKPKSKRRDEPEEDEDEKPKRRNRD